MDTSAAGPSARPAPAVRMRAQASLFLLLGLLVALAGRLFGLQVLRHEDMAAAGARQRSRTRTLVSLRGDILFLDGSLAARSVMVRDYYVDPSRVRDPARLASAVAAALGRDPAWAARLAADVHRSRSRRERPIARRLQAADCMAMRAVDVPEMHLDAAERPLAIYSRETPLRLYPRGTLAAHVLGLVRYEDQELRGMAGVEAARDGILRGEPGHRVENVDALGRPIFLDHALGATGRAPRDGETVRLSIHPEVQAACERVLDEAVGRWQPRGACAVILSPADGAILAMASRPAFDPNARVTLDPAATKDLCIAARYEPGSTFKPLVAAAALEAGAVRLDEVIDCEDGIFRVPGTRRVLHDHHPYGLLSFPEVIIKSSNIGMAKVGLALGDERLRDAVLAYGLEGRTGLGLPGEVEPQVTPAARWSTYTTTSVPMGHEVALTPLALAAGYAALASGGVWHRPYLFLPPEGRRGAPPGRRVLEEATARAMTEILVRVVEEGTGQRARLEGVAVAGKTGTAQKREPGGRYSHSRFVSTFVAYAPAEAPRAVVLVLVDEPRGAYYGGTVAAPAVRSILEAVLPHIPRCTTTGSPDEGRNGNGEGC
ncbi:MAG: penicillin-binding protein 2 [Planctomycetes bacterium]|nr:penicillin-binding protein 2 [Planctomycetota bacterium]